MKIKVRIAVVVWEERGKLKWHSYGAHYYEDDLEDMSDAMADIDPASVVDRFYVVSECEIRSPRRIQAKIERTAQ